METRCGTVSGRGNQYTDEMPSSWILCSHRENNTSCGGAMISQAIKENKSNLNNSGGKKCVANKFFLLSSTSNSEKAAMFIKK